MNRAVFLDRDGTLIEEAGYLDRLQRLQLFPWSVDAVRLLNRAGFLVVVVTNQAGVARGIIRPAFIGELHEELSRRFAAGGARIDAFYYCPHHPEATVEQFRLRCDCRKPQPGMLRQAAGELNIDLTRSFVIGDRWIDMQMAQAVGATGIMVRTGYGASEEHCPPENVAAAAIVPDAMTAVSWILLAHGSSTPSR